MAGAGTLLIIDPGLQLWGSERALAATLKALTEAWDRVVLVTPPDAELAGLVAGDPATHGLIILRTAPIGMLHKKGGVAKLRAMVAVVRRRLELRPARIYLNQAGLGRLLAPLLRICSVPATLHVRILEDIPRVMALPATARAPMDLVFISDAMSEAAGPATPAHMRRFQAYDPYPLTPLPEALPMVAPFVSLGRLSHGKGMHLLVEALEDPRLAHTRADIFGEGVAGDSYADDITVRAREGAGKGGARFMGFQRDVMSHLPAYHFLVSGSRYETLGRVVMEGWEAGLVPVVYGGSGGAAEMVRKSGAGVIYDDWTGTALADALVQAIALSDTDRSTLAAQGRAWMAQALGLDDYRTALAGTLFPGAALHTLTSTT
jgi:hypothetical protein